MNNIRRTAAALTAVTMLASAAGCGSKNSNKTFDSMTADKLVSRSYTAVKLNHDLPLAYANDLRPLGDSGDFLLTGYGSEDGAKMYVVDKDFENFEELNFSIKTEGNEQTSFDAVPAPDGTIIVFGNITDYGDFELPDYDDPDFDYESFDFDAMYAAATTTNRIYTLDRSGNIITENEVTGIKELMGEDAGEYWIGQPVALGSDLLLSAEGRETDGSRFFTITTEGKLGKELDMGDIEYMNYPANDSNGDLVFLSWDSDGESIRTVDAKNVKLTVDAIKLTDLGIERDIQRIVPGSGDYRYYLSGSSAFYGVTADNKAEEVINWTDSDLNGEYIRAVAPLDNGEFIVLEEKWGASSGTNIYRLTERDPSELADTKVITIVADYSNPDIIDKITEFNQSRTDYRIKIEDYSTYYEWDDSSNKALNTPENQLKMDIAAGKTFDMMILGSETSLYYNLVNKGMFADLSQFLDSGSGLTKKDFVPNALEALSDGDKLYRISPTFTVQTYAAKKKYVDRDKWTFDEMLEDYSKCPKDMYLFEYCFTKMHMFTNLYYGMMNGFLDYENGTCSFDSPEFIKILEFVNGLDYEVDIDWDSMTDEEQQEYDKKMQEYSCKNDRALLKGIHFYDARTYNDTRYGDMGEEMSLVGSPSSDGNGGKIYNGRTFMITSASPCKEVCWEFISSFFTEDNYFGGDNRFNGIPTVEKYLDRMLDEAMEDPYWIDAEGKKQTYKQQAWVGDKAVEIPNMTQEERDALKEYLLGAGYSPYVYNEKVNDIVVEEIDAFFAGERSAKETANIIQNRVSILVSEQN